MFGNSLYHELIFKTELPDDFKVSDEFTKTMDAYYDKFMEDSKQELYPLLMPDDLKMEFESRIPQIRKLFCDAFSEATERDDFVKILLKSYLEWANGETKLLEIMLCVSALAHHICKRWKFIKKDIRPKRIANASDEQIVKRVRTDATMEGKNESNGVAASTVDKVRNLPDDVVILDIPTPTLPAKKNQLPMSANKLNTTVSATPTNGAIPKQPPKDPRRKLHIIPPIDLGSRHSDIISSPPVFPRTSILSSPAIRSVAYSSSNDYLVPQKANSPIVPEKSNNVVNSNAQQSSFTNGTSANVEDEDSDDEQNQDSRRSVRFVTEPIIHEVVPHITEDLVDSGHVPTPKDNPTKNYEEISFEHVPGFERKVDIGKISGASDGLVPYSPNVIPLPKYCDLKDWHKYNDGLIPSTVENFIEILQLFHCSQPKTNQGRLTRLFIHDTLLRPTNISYRFSQHINIGFPTSYDVFFDALEMMRKRKENAYVMDRIYISIGCDLVMRAFNDKDCLNDVIPFFNNFFYELEKDFGPDSLPRTRSHGAVGTVAPKYPVIYIINVPFWTVNNPRIKTYNKRFKMLNDYLEKLVNTKALGCAALGLVIQLVDWHKLSLERVAFDGYEEPVEQKDASTVLDIRYAVLNHYLIQEGEMVQKKI
uniref:Uncharacterized protein n=1 Tax=Panagrolaimus sp. JU765 TaxID=591449 RepID=A0AC34Q4M6_9BILA